MASAPAAAGAPSDPYRPNSIEEKHMSRKLKTQPVVRKPTQKIADPRRVRYGFGCAPAKVVRSADAAISDSGAIRFGFGCAPASLRK